MKGIKERFANIRFTQEEQAELAQRLCRAAEQEGTMTEGAKGKVKKVSRGVVIGLARRPHFDCGGPGGGGKRDLGRLVLLPGTRRNRPCWRS